VEAFCEQLDVLNAAGAFKRGRATNRPSFKLLTLTLRAVPRGAGELRAAAGRIFESWRKLQQAVGFERDKRERLFGAIAVVEVGPRRNVHLHVLYWGRYVPQARLSATWRALTGDSYVVDIRELRGSWRDAAREVCKYVTKAASPANWTGSRDAEPSVPELLLVDVFEALKGRRRVASYGLFYNVKTPDEPARTCETCGAVLVYVGTFDPETLAVAELRDRLERLQRERPP